MHLPAMIKNKVTIKKFKAVGALKVAIAIKIN